MKMFVTTSSTVNNNHPPSYIVATASTTTTTTTTNSGIETTTTAATTTTTTNSNTPQTLSDIKLICTQRKKKTKRHIYLTFVESCPISSSIDQPCIEIIRKSNSSSQPSSYSLNECISFEYFDTVKNDFQSYIYAYFESYTVSIFFSDEDFDKKSLIIKHLEYMYHSKAEKASEINNNSSQDPSQSQPGPPSQSQSQQQPILPCPSTTEQILHTFDVNLIPYGPIIHRDHMLIGPARLYFTTTDLYIASMNCNRTDLKITITNQCPSKEKAILCVPYFTIKNYGNRSNIFLIELGKSNYGNGEIHMKCHSSSLASTIHLLVSPVIEERPLILSSAFQNQLLTTKRIEKSKNIHPPVQLTHDTMNQPLIDSPIPLLKKKSIDTTQIDSQITSSSSSTTGTTSNDIKSRFIVGFFRTLTKNVSHLRRSATFHHNNHNHTNNNNEQVLTSNTNTLLPKNKSVAFNIDENNFHNDQHQIILPESQKKNELTSNIPSIIPKEISETTLTSPSTTKQDTTMGTYIDMGPTIHRTDSNLEEKIEDEVIGKETTATAEIGVNTTISLSPCVRSAIIVGNSVHLIADEKTLFPIGQRSFTSPASVMQPFKTQLNGPSMSNTYATTSDLITSSPNSSSSIPQVNSVSNSQQSLFLSYGIVTFNKNDIIPNDQTERPTSPILEGSALDRRLNSDLSLMSMPQQQGSTVYPFDSVLSSSNAHIFPTLSVSTNNNGDTTSGSIRTPHGSIIFFEDHLHDQATTYLLGLPAVRNDETIQTNLSRLSSFNLTSSISRPQLSHIDEQETSSNDPYALVEPLPQKNSTPSTSINTLNTPLPTSENSLDYVDLLIPSHVNNENPDTNEQQQQQIMNLDDNNDDEINDCEEKERENLEQSSTKLYTDIDFHQTQRRDRIVQSANRAKIEDQTPPFVL
ncbi:unnamed protein product [Adineta steineri]|uniref:IRS-type PTB domain-containing protein n=2 Tax=Adineta steineri TaxID=433720 RepID=A0A819B0E3_9BILA|nr:unnamed protein product [Adineta steineri]CAF3785194.1 unnamed protein product [Adineta steineri]